MGGCPDTRAVDPNVSKEIWFLRLGEIEIQVLRNLQGSGRNKELIRSCSWEEIRRVSFETGGTSANVAALATFGVLGLGARKPRSVISIEFSDETAVFVIFKALHQLKPLHDVLRRAGVPGEKLIYGGGASASVDPSNSLVTELERLANLFEQGVLTEDEFTAAKALLIEGS